jgi:hypothetical protein
MEIATEKLLQAMDKERTRRQMSDRKFSKDILGISPAYLSLLKAGKRPLTPNLAVMFMQKLPELAPAVTEFVVSQGNNNQKEEDLITKNPRNP